MSRLLSEELLARGFVHQYSGGSLEQILDAEKRVFYLGVDPTATSLTIGNLAAYMLARHLADAGHTPILLVGGGTGMIGDPGGKESERKLLDDSTLQKNIAGIRVQVEKILGVPVTVVNNAEWLSGLNLIEFLRDVGKHFTVNAMIKKDIVKNRLDIESPISYTEFTYSLLQAYDFWYLCKKHNCTLQIAGSDQWTNILAGVDYTKKIENREVFGLTNPIIVNPETGKKFGKSEEGALWLDPEQTSPYKLYQYLLNVSDEAVESLLKIYTLLSLFEIEEIMETQRQSPELRRAQRTLAYEVVKFVHGAKVEQDVEMASRILFGGSEKFSPNEESLRILAQEAPTFVVRDKMMLTALLVEGGLASSLREARTFVEEGAISIDGIKLSDPGETIMGAPQKPQLLRRGKKHLVILLP